MPAAPWITPPRAGWEGRLRDKRPYLSIITPSLNQAAYLEQAIESVLSQGYDRLEYIVMDGGSTDGSLDIIRRHADRLAHWVSEPDGGQVDAINRGLQRSTGDVVAYLNADDYYLQGAIPSALESLAEHPTTGFVYGASLVVDERGEEIWKVPAREFDLDALVHGTMYMSQPATFLLRHALAEVGPFASDLDYVFDWDMVIRLGKRFGGVASPAYLAAIREYPTTKTNTGGFGRCEEIRRCVERHTGRPFTLGSLHYYVYELRRALTALGLADHSRLLWEVIQVQAALAEMIAEDRFLHRIGPDAPPARFFQREDDLLARVVERDTEIRRLQAVLQEAVDVRDTEIRRLQGVLAEAVDVRDREIYRLQAVLADAVGVRDGEIQRLQTALQRATSRPRPK